MINFDYKRITDCFNRNYLYGYDQELNCNFYMLFSLNFESAI